MDTVSEPRISLSFFTFDIIGVSHLKSGARMTMFFSEVLNWYYNWNLARRGGWFRAQSSLSPSPFDLLQRRPAERKFKNVQMNFQWWWAHLLKEISGSTTIEPSVSTPSTLNTCGKMFQNYNIVRSNEQTHISHLVFWIRGICGFSPPTTQNLIQYWRPWYKRVKGLPLQAWTKTTFSSWGGVWPEQAHLDHQPLQ